MTPEKCPESESNYYSTTRNLVVFQPVLQHISSLSGVPLKNDPISYWSKKTNVELLFFKWNIRLFSYDDISFVCIETGPSFTE